MLIFTDLDGCLLDKATYSCEPARQALALLRERRIPLILCSSKTAAEMRVLHGELALATPMVCENGNVIAGAGDGDPDQIVGTPRTSIQEVLDDLREFSFRTFSDLGVAGVAAETGLSLEAADRACQRQCSEPMQWLDDEARIPAFRAKLESAGLTLTRGGRFWHIAGAVNKGDGMAALLKRLNPEHDRTVVAIGDSPIDVPMFAHCDVGIVIPQPDGTRLIDPAGDRIVFADQPGPAGWNATVLSVLSCA